MPSPPRTRAAFEKVTTGLERSFTCRRLRVRNFAAPYHYHPEVELTWIVKSTGHRFVGDSIAAFSDGDLALIGPNLPHVWMNHTGCRRAEALVIQFLPGFMGPVFVDLPEMGSIRRLLEQAGRGLIFSDQTRQKVSPLLERLHEAEGPSRVIGLLGILQELSQDSSASPLCSPDYLSATSAGAEVRINKVYRQLTTGFTETIFQADAARSIGMTPAAFSRFFRKTTGRGFTEALLDLRLSHACMLLRESDHTVAEICYRCGFENLSNFNRQFRRRHGMPPREWRRLAMQAVSG
jgi:AraC-like DNA-binding protein